MVGLEFRCRLATRTKLFSPCPSTQVDAHTLALPGTLPTLNRRAVDLALRLSLALGAEIQPVSRWVRRHYFAPTLPKGYQICQLESPLARGGAIEVDGRALGLAGIHLAEDVGELGPGGVDLTRSGAPLLEVIGEATVLRTGPAEASACLRALKAIVRASRVADPDLPGALRCDAHVSLCPKGQEGAGLCCAIRDLGSGRVLEQAIAAEIRRQAALLDRGLTVVSMTAEADHLYLPEPDLPPLRIDAAWIERARAELPDPLRNLP